MLQEKEIILRIDANRVGILILPHGLAGNGKYNIQFLRTANEALG